MFTGVSDTPVAPEESIMFSDNQIILDLQLIPEFNKPGGSVKFEIAQDLNKPLKVLVINSMENGFQAYENRCTHGGREIEYEGEDNILQCVSFGHSKYDLNGQVIRGPAPSPLRKFNVNHTDDQLIITQV